jgi:hypothetical protein
VPPLIQLNPGCGAIAARPAKKAFFFAKKNQKTFAFEESAPVQPARRKAKSFCCFFQKEALPCFG